MTLTCKTSAEDEFPYQCIPRATYGLDYSHYTYQLILIQLCLFRQYNRI